MHRATDQGLFCNYNDVPFTTSVLCLSSKLQASLPKLYVLTAYNNPVTYKQGYRHLLVNTLPNLILLDQYIVSDEELVEKAKFPPKFARFSPNFEVHAAVAASATLLHFQSSHCLSTPR